MATNFNKAYKAYKKRATTHPHEFGKLARKQILRDYGKDYELKSEPASKVCEFIEMLPDPSTNEPIRLFPFQVYILFEIFGWYHKGTNKRKHTLAYMLIGRKNGKTTLTAAIGLYSAFLAGQRRALVANLATAERQAKILFDTAKVFIKEAPEIFRTELGVRAMVNEIRRESHNQIFRFYPAKETGALDGIQPYNILIDEIASMKNPRLYTVMRSSMGAMENQLMIAFSSASHNQSIGYELYQQSEAVINGDVNLPHFLPLIFNLDNEDDPYDERNWIKSTPVLMSDTKLSASKLDDLRQMARESKLSDSVRKEFTTKQLGLWLHGADNYFNTDKLQTCAEPLTECKTAKIVYGGLDMALRRDLTAFAWVWRDSPTSYAMGYRAWLPFETIQASETLQAYAKAGWLTPTAGNVIDSSDVANFIIDFARNHRLIAVNYDPAKSYDVLTRLDEANVPATSFTQNTRTFSPPMSEMARLIETDNWHMVRNPLLMSNFQSTEVMIDTQNNVKPIKRGKSAHDKIDIVVAAVMALAYFINPNVGEKPVSPITDEQFANFMKIYE